MVVNFEFLDSEPIENIITCMNFKVDKVVFFGSYEMINNQKEHTESFLKDSCGVQEIRFRPLPLDDLPSILRIMRNAIERELEDKNEIFFDVTGGEWLILVAFGMLSKEYHCPMHYFDVVDNCIVELEEGAKACISTDVEKQSVRLTLDQYINMWGGIINTNLQKEVKEVEDIDFQDDVQKIWNVASRHGEYWNPFTNFIQKNLSSDNSMVTTKKAGRIISALRESESILKTPAKLNEIIDDLAAVGLLRNVIHKEGVYQIEYANQKVKDCLLEGGMILELYTYLQEMKNSDDCRVGVHIDWDGVIHKKPGEDVLNEIDVISLRHNVPVFISCKSGKMNSQQVLHALYELDTVSRRFGGKYAKKILATVSAPAKVYLERAREMGIEVRVG